MGMTSIATEATPGFACAAEAGGKALPRGPMFVTPPYFR